MKKVILIDVDGVLVKWQSGLPFFNSEFNLPMDSALHMQLNDVFIKPEQIFGVDSNLATKLMDMYNNSKYIKYLSPYTDALSFVNQNKDEYDFIAVTALSSETNAIINRMYNLNSLFPHAFKEILSCDYNKPKTELFFSLKKKYGSRIIAFIDDLAKNIDDCYDVFSDDINYYHVKRGDRDAATIGVEIKELTEIKLGC